MNKVKCTILISIFFATVLFSQDKRIKISIDFLGAFSFSPNQGIYDSFSRHDYAWFNNTKTGADIELRIKVKLPYGFQPYIGCHYSRFFESDNGPSLWNKIYYRDFVNDYHITKDKINTRSIGANSGFLYELYWLKLPVDICLIFDHRIVHFRSETQIEGYGFSINSNKDEEFKGNSDLETKWHTAYGLGIGVFIPISIFNLILESKYVYAWGDIIKRENPFEWGGEVYIGKKYVQGHPMIRYGYLKILIGVSIPFFKL